MGVEPAVAASSGSLSSALAHEDSVSAAMAMAYGRGPADPRVGFLVGPPYAPLLVGSG